MEDGLLHPRVSLAGQAVKIGALRVRPKNWNQLPN